MFFSNQKILLVARTDEAIHRGKIVQMAIDNFPDWLKPSMSKNTVNEKRFSVTDSIFWFGAATAARSKSVTLLIIDEASFIHNMEDHWKAIYPAVATGAKVIVLSTVKMGKNWFRKTYCDAVEGKNNFYVFESDYREHPDFNNDVRCREMRERLGEHGWRQEVLGDFLDPGATKNI